VPGCTIKKSSTTATLTERSLDIALRHNDLQSGLYEFLTDVHGAAAVATEHRTSTGTRVDVAVHSDDGMVYYEIKTDLSARACVRAALAQLLEYSYWPGGREARELVVVGEPPIDDETKTFLGRLNEGFGLPIRYARFDARVGKLRE
jgi:hypothetical protein